MNEYRDWTFDPVNYPQAEVKAFIEGLHANNQHQILITDPGIKYESGYKYYEYGRELDIFLKNSTGDDFIGRVWPGNTVFPDFLHPRAYEYWKTSIQDFLELVPVDGNFLVLSSFCSFSFLSSLFSLLLTFSLLLSPIFTTFLSPLFQASGST